MFCLYLQFAIREHKKWKCSHIFGHRGHLWIVTHHLEPKGIKMENENGFIRNLYLENTYSSIFV